MSLYDNPGCYSGLKESESLSDYHSLSRTSSDNPGVLNINMTSNQLARLFENINNKLESSVVDDDHIYYCDL